MKNKKRKKIQRIRMAPIDSRLYKPERITVIHYATEGTAEHFSKLGWGKGRGRGRLTEVGNGSLRFPS